MPRIFWKGLKSFEPWNYLKEPKVGGAYLISLGKMVTYPEIFELLRKDKYPDKIQELGSGFLEDVATYLQEKKALLEREREEHPDFFNETIEQTKKQLENAKSMLRELFTVREKKIIELALIASKTGISRTDAKSLLVSEKDLFETVFQKLKDNEGKLLGVMEGIKKLEDDNLLVKFTADVPKFVDLAGGDIGPFKEKDVANLPKKIAETLIRNKIVEVMEL